MMKTLIAASCLVSATLGFTPLPSFSARNAVQSTTTSLEAASKVFLAGGSQEYCLSRILAEKIAKTGKEVVVMAKTDDFLDMMNEVEGVTAVRADALVRKDIEDAMDGCDAVISMLGSGENTKMQYPNLEQLDYNGNAAVIESAGILGITRTVLVTTIGAGDTADAPPPQVIKELKTMFAAKTKVEVMLADTYTNMDWTILRPGGLTMGGGTGNAILTERTDICGSLERGDLADIIIDLLDNPKSYKKTLSVVDPTPLAIVGNTEAYEGMEASLD